MEDIMQKLQGILSTKDGQDQLKNIASMFSQNTGNNQNNQSSNIINNITEKLNEQSAQSAQSAQSTQSTHQLTQENLQENPMGGFDINALLGLQKVFSSMNSKDKNTELLLALKPHFSAERAQKVDKAISMMKLFSMAPTIMPMLKDSGILKSILPF